jgi:hypothetical protein
MARQYVNPVGVDGKRKRGRPAKTVVAQAEAQMLAQMQAEQDTNETESERVKRISERFTVMYKLTQGAINGHVRSLIVSGAAGTGKSHTINHLLDQAASTDAIRYEPIVGAQVTGINLFKLLYRMRNEQDIILMDDSDSIWEDEIALNLMKAALDTTAVRRLSWLSESAALKAEEIPQQFEYKGSVIFITNKDFQSIVDLGKSKLSPHFSALMSRSIYLDLKLHRSKDLLAWILHMVSKNHILHQNGLTRKEEDMVLAWTRENYTEFRELSIRTLLKVATFVKSSPTDWETFAKVTILR